MENRRQLSAVRLSTGDRVGFRSNENPVRVPRDSGF